MSGFKAALKALHTQRVAAEQRLEALYSAIAALEGLDTEGQEKRPRRSAVVRRRPRKARKVAPVARVGRPRIRPRKVKAPRSVSRFLPVCLEHKAPIQKDDAGSYKCTVGGHDAAECSVKDTETGDLFGKFKPQRAFQSAARRNAA